MRRVRRFSTIAVVLLVGVAPFACASFAQPSTAHYSGQVEDAADHPLAGIAIKIAIGDRTLETVTDASGKFDLSSDLSTGEAGPATLIIALPGFAPVEQTIVAGQPLSVHLSPASVNQRVVVTASRTALALNQSANTVRVVSRQALQHSATIALGDQLRQVPGLQFFRRSSVLVSNPTSQGVSLRGLGSTGASRSLVLADGVPINDPFGGWVYWDQVPSLAIEDIEVVRGGASDLYGSSAVGGVINMLERQPGPTSYALDLGYAGENTPHVSAFGTTSYGPWSGLFAGDFLRTDGYIEVAPSERGTVDTPANVHYQNAELDLRRSFTEHGDAFLRGNFLNEARGNGTPMQTNGTRLWRYVGGGDLTTERAGTYALRLFGSQEHYRQSFSAIAADRGTEFLVRLQQVPIQQLGASLQWTRNVRPWFTLLAGSDVDDVRATDFELPISQGQPNGLSDTSARQRDVGAYAEALLQLRQWTVSGSFRVDNFLNLDALQYLQTGIEPVTVSSFPNRTETVVNPKIGVVRRLNPNVALTASAYRAFRSPTLNELYRGFRVGNKITLANPDLRSERATGWETGMELAAPSRNSVLRASYFWTEVNRPVISLTLKTTPSEILTQRENLGQIRSRGVSLDFETEPLPWLFVTGGYQYANATVTQFAQDPDLIGNWIPEVAHNMATAQVRATKRKFGTVKLLGTVSGRQYDDDANQFLLHGYFQLDAYVSHAAGSHVDLYGAVANMFDRSIEVGRTPVLTLAMPRVASIGLRFHSAGSR